MRRLAGGLAVIVAVLVVSASPVDAHPLGNFTINHFAGLEVAPDGVRIDYVLDLAEIPTFQERLVNEVPAMDRCRELADGVELSIDGRPVVLSVEGGRIDFLAGQGGLETTRIECRYVAKLTKRATNDHRTQKLLGLHGTQATIRVPVAIHLGKKSPCITSPHS